MSLNAQKLQKLFPTNGRKIGKNLLGQTSTLILDKMDRLDAYFHKKYQLKLTQII